jgi:hypothetical protein
MSIESLGRSFCELGRQSLCHSIIHCSSIKEFSDLSVVDLP